MPFADIDSMPVVLTLDLFLIGGFGLVVLLARLLFWPRDPKPGQRLPLATSALILAGAVGLPVAWMMLAEWWGGIDNTLRADALVVFHLGFVVVAMLLVLLIIAGGVVGWKWVRNFWFRLFHLLAILIVVGQASVNAECPFTTWERDLRGGSLSNLDDASSLGRFCNQTLYHPTEDPRGLIVRYLIVGGVIAGSWLLVRPRLPGRSE